MKKILSLIIALGSLAATAAEVHNTHDMVGNDITFRRYTNALPFATATNYADASLSATTTGTWYYALQASNSSGTLALGPVTTQTVSGTGMIVRLTWPKHGGMTGYRIWRGTATNLMTNVSAVAGGASTTNWYDYGTNVWTSGVASNSFTNTTPGIVLADGTRIDGVGDLGSPSAVTNGGATINGTAISNGAAITVSGVGDMEKSEFGGPENGTGIVQRAETAAGADGIYLDTAGPGYEALPTGFGQGLKVLGLTGDASAFQWVNASDFLLNFITPASASDVLTYDGSAWVAASVTNMIPKVGSLSMFSTSHNRTPALVTSNLLVHGNIRGYAFSGSNSTFTAFRPELASTNGAYGYVGWIDGSANVWGMALDARATNEPFARLLFRTANGTPASLDSSNVLSAAYFRGAHEGDGSGLTNLPVSTPSTNYILRASDRWVAHEFPTNPLAMGVASHSSTSVVQHQALRTLQTQQMTRTVSLTFSRTSSETNGWIGFAFPYVAQTNIVTNTLQLLVSGASQVVHTVNFTTSGFYTVASGSLSNALTVDARFTGFATSPGSTNYGIAFPPDIYGAAQ